ncbi:MAG: hypothetical protein JJE39_08120 [Vicinamibacteria bacterium]|nr:hypothetical protein [Vicinamibacteria bacterium]
MPSLPTIKARSRWIDQFVFIVVASLLAASAQTDDLAALARKEKERRAKITKKAKVLTESDGKLMAEEGGGSVTMMEAANPSESAPPSSNAPSSEAAKEVWKSRAVSVRAQVKAAEATLEQLEHELAVFRSDQAPLNAAEAQDPLRLQKREAKMAEMNKAVELQKSLVVEAKKSVTVFEEEARRNGVPPGWLR